MENAPTQTHWAVRIGYGLAALLLVYPFSLGPAIVVHRRFPRSRPATETVYLPMKCLLDTPLERPLNAYGDWWENLAQRQD